jgi:hypothetical protein
MALKVCFLGAVRRRTFICCRNIQISTWSAARDRNRSATIQTMSLTRSLITQQHRPILDQLLVRLSLRQGQLCAEGWVDADGVCSREAAAQAVIAAVESGISQAACGTIAAGISLLLGPEGRQRHLEDVTRIRGENQIPILSVLIADAGTMTSFTTGVPRPTVH